MSDLATGCLDWLPVKLAGYVSIPLESISREFPMYVSARMTAPADFTLGPACQVGGQSLEAPFGHVGIRLHEW